MPFARLRAAFAPVLDLLHAVTRGQRELALQVVVLRQHVGQYRRQVTRAPLSCSARLGSSAARRADPPCPWPRA